MLFESFENSPMKKDQCFECSQYFDGVVDLAFNDDDTNSIKAQKIGIYADAQSKSLINALDVLTEFIKGTASLSSSAHCKSKPSDIGPEYFKCLREYVTCQQNGMKTLQGKLCPPEDMNCTAYKETVARCGTIATLVDNILKKATICSNNDCEDVSKYPKDQERTKCRETSVCKTKADLEKNMLSEIEKVRKEVLACSSKLTDATSDCVLNILAIIATKHTVANMSTNDSLTPKLGSIVGSDDVAFDLASLVLAN